MRRPTLRDLIIGAAVPAVALCLGAVVLGAGFASIRYGPNMLVDSKALTSYVEPAIASDPSDARTLVASAELASFNAPPQAFVSHDGGYDWHAAPLLLGRGTLLGDVQLASGPNADIYFAALGAQGERHGIHFCASTNHGDWFNHIAFIENHHGRGFDHEQLAVDTSRGRYRGRVYMSVLYIVRLQPQLNACGLLWSTDGGRRFHGPVKVIDGWCFNSRPIVLSDGTVIFPFYINGAPGASGVPSSGARAQNVDVAISRDGGKMFTPPRTIGTYEWLGAAEYKRRMAEAKTDFDGDPVPQFAAGPSPLTHRDVIYGAWSDMRTGDSRLLFTKSTDEGRHWSRPVRILTTGHPHDAQYQVSLAVNGRGVLGVAYLQYSSTTGRIMEMFADSADGGTTFSRPVAIQSTPEKIGFPANSGYFPIASRLPSSALKGRTFIGFVNPARRFPSGGDYVQMAVDRSGAFHPVWADARTGTSQIWTASVSAGAATSVPSNLAEADVTGDVDVQFGARTWDKARHLLTIPVRLRNIGKLPLYPPFTVAITQLRDPLVPASWAPRVTPSLVNADNGRHGVGAVYTYGSRMLGNLSVLEPGAETAPRTWKIVVNGQYPAIVVRVDGYESRER